MSDPSARDFAELRDWLNAPEILCRFPPERYYALCDALDLAEAVRWCAQNDILVAFTTMGDEAPITVCLYAGRRLAKQPTFLAAVAEMRERLEGEKK